MQASTSVVTAPSACFSCKQLKYLAKSGMFRSACGLGGVFVVLFAVAFVFAFAVFPAVAFAFAVFLAGVAFVVFLVVRAAAFVASATVFVACAGVATASARSSVRRRKKIPLLRALAAKYFL